MRSVGQALASRVVVIGRSWAVVLRMGGVACDVVVSTMVVVVVKAPSTGLQEHERQPLGSVSQTR